MTDELYEGIAIVGMSGRFPGAQSVEELWSNLLAERESISFFSDEDLARSGIDVAAVRARGKYVPARGVLDHAEDFDAAFFGVHPKEAEVMDPQQRVFLETCWAALENAGYAPARINGSVGVFGGSTFNTYQRVVLDRRPDLTETIGSELVMFGNERDYLATRVAYKLGLKGPALSVSTACSTSLVSVVLACQSLLTYQSDVALAGGVSITFPQQRGYEHDEGNIGSADGHTRTFDARSSGTAFSNGVAVVVLKRLADAVADGDDVVAVIKGAALNNDGSHRVSFGAPGVEGQSEVIAMAQALAGVHPDTISYVEAHGTATPLGDPIEIAGLTKAFRLGTQARQYCGIGSLKSNIGHLDVAAGVAGLIKVALSLRNRTIPATLHFSEPNPRLHLEESPFFVNATRRDWAPCPGAPRRAGVSAFGTGGTNAHVILEEAPTLPASDPPAREYELLPISAKTTGALEQATQNLAAHFRSAGVIQDPSDAARRLADAAFTLQTGRSEFSERRVVVCRDCQAAVEALEAGDAKQVFTGRSPGNSPQVAFMFPGQGAQVPGMGASLYRLEPAFREAVDTCVDILRPVLGLDLRTVMFTEATEAAARRLEETRYTQPALFTIEYALAQLLMSWGIAPAAMVGHSVGEYVAACLSKVFSLEDALTLVARRGAMVQELPAGAMLAVRAAERDVLPLLGPLSAIAAVNAPSLCVAAGPNEEIASLESALAARSVTSRRLHTSHAFHSPMMAPVMEPFEALVSQVALGAPVLPFVSNLTEDWVTEADARDPHYWARHVRETVRFAGGLARLMGDPKYILLEVGPGQTLSTLARQHPDRAPDRVTLSSLPTPGTGESLGLLQTLGRLWIAGCQVDWSRFRGGERRLRVPLPSYPFERKRYFPDGGVPVKPNAASSVEVPTQVGAPSPVPPTALSAAPDITAQTESASGSRRSRLVTDVVALMQDLSGYELSTADPAADLLELGLDSLLLTQAATLLQRRFGVRISFRQLMEELGSSAAIAAYLDERMPPDPAPPIPSPALSTAATPMPAGALEQLLSQQQELTARLLTLMGKTPTAGVPVVTRPTLPAPLPVQAGVSGASAPAEGKSHGPFRPLERGASPALTPEQSRALEALIERYTARTRGSKASAALNRPVLADPRSAAGFKQAWKEMVYPIVTTRSDGSRVWDVDGNEYIDFVMGFGASLFGHRPRFVIDAVHRQLDLGFEIGPVQPLAGEVAALIREFTSMERVGFTNTGSEAVLAATRVARTVSGRDKIAVFAGAYHGIFDEVLFRPTMRDGQPAAAPIAPGIPQTALGQVVVLEYGSQESLEYLRTHGEEFAAVLVEPVQSRRLDLQPRDFLHELRRITRETDTALVFDEVVLGFRLHPGGAQAYFDIRADLATYGKVVGGGLPIGVVTGSAKYMDALDGGRWQYGDASFPEVGVTFFAGTFVRHPLVLAAARAVLLHLKAEGPGLQERLNQRTQQLAAELQDVLDEFSSPYRVTQFSSLIQLVPDAHVRLASLLYYLLRLRGIHIWDNRAFIITTAHSEEDFRTLIGSLRESLAEMQRVGFIPGGSLALPSGMEQAASTTTAAAVARGPDANMSIAAQFPTTEAQREIWLAAQMGGDSAVAYNESLRLDFSGEFDASVFRAAVAQVLRRHPILLARVSEDGQSQVVDPTREFACGWEDLAGRPDVERDARLRELIAEEATEAFSLVSGPLLRVTIVRLSPVQHVVLWTAHHIICDGWSAGLVISELAAIYSAAKQGLPAPVLETPASFRGYAVAQQFSTAEIDKDVDYWRAQFLTPPAPLDLPTDRPRATVRTARASTAGIDVPEPLHLSLRRVAAKHRTTMVGLLMAGLQTLLYRLTGQTDFVVGLAAAGQAVEENGCLVGHCVSLVPIRTQLRPEAPFAENLTVVRKSVLDGTEHRRSSIGRILQHVHVPRIPGRQPLIEVVFNVDRDAGAAQFANVDFMCGRNPKRASHYDLFFNCVEGPSGLRIECDYADALFDRATIERWLDHYRTLLEGISVDPLKCLAELPVLSEAQRRRMLVEWNETKREPRQPDTLHGLVQAQVSRQPDAIAVTFEGVSLTYAELNRRANQVAKQLAKRGVGPDVVVGLCVERGLEMVIGALGILKSGGAYLPLDIAYPKARLAFMLEDSGAPILVTQRAMSADVPAAKSLAYIEDLLQGPGDDMPGAASSRHAAYVIYTSGSTGEPKGVVIEHRSVVNLVTSICRDPGFSDRDVMLAVTTLSFDIATAELFLPLTSGGRLVVASRAVAADGAQLVELIRESGATFMQPTPVTWQMLLAAGWQGTPDLKMISTGEPLPADLAARLLSKGAGLWNLYGPTETTIWSTGCRITDTDVPISIGRPIANTTTYIVDARMEPVPIGAPGELLIGGAGVARGYLNRPALTAERFIPSPFDDAGRQTRLYRTGDLARYKPDGSIECLGRIDHQVKLRGYRIELGEIETALGRHAQVESCVVIDRPSPQGDKWLVAYFETRGPSVPSAAELRAHLKESLPEFIVPAVFLPLAALPRTPNGKVDRKALPSPDGSQSDLVRAYVPPSDILERELAGLWAKCLKVPRVGKDDNFFELGGHSVAAVGLLAEVEKLTGQRLPLAALFRVPTVAGLAAMLREGGWEESWASVVPIQPNGSRPPLFLVHGAEGNVLLYRSLAEHLGSDQPVYGLQARGLRGTAFADRSVEEMAKAYVKELVVIQPSGPYYLGGYCMGGLIALEMARELRAAGQEVACLFLLDTYAPTDVVNQRARILAPIHFLQNLWFHVANTISVPARDRERFVRQKVQTELGRLRIRREALLGSAGWLPDRNGQYPHLEVTRMNDLAADLYVPHQYDGSVTVIRPKGYFLGLSSSSLGWEKFVRGRLIVREVPAFPKGMLVEPFCRSLAAILTETLQGARA